MKRILEVAAMASVCVLLLTSSAHAQVCSDASLKGTYGYTEIGAPWNVVGLKKFDGKGTVTNDATLVFPNGSVEGSGTELWTYTVSSDCQFTITNLTGNQYFGVIVLNGRELRWVIGTGGFVAKGEAYRRFAD